MFWNEDDLAELEGTSLVGPSMFRYHGLPDMQFIPFLWTEKLGRAQAELSYKEKVVPAIQVRACL